MAPRKGQPTDRDKALADALLGVPEGPKAANESAEVADGNHGLDKPRLDPRLLLALLVALPASLVMIPKPAAADWAGYLHNDNTIYLHDTETGNVYTFSPTGGVNLQDIAITEGLDGPLVTVSSHDSLLHVGFDGDGTLGATNTKAGLQYIGKLSDDGDFVFAPAQGGFFETDPESSAAPDPLLNDPTQRYLSGALYTSGAGSVNLSLSQNASGPPVRHISVIIDGVDTGVKAEVPYSVGDVNRIFVDPDNGRILLSGPAGLSSITFDPENPEALQNDGGISSGDVVNVDLDGTTGQVVGIFDINENECIAVTVVGKVHYFDRETGASTQAPYDVTGGNGGFMDAEWDPETGLLRTAGTDAFEIDPVARTASQVTGIVPTSGTTEAIAYLATDDEVDPGDDDDDDGGDPPEQEDNIPQELLDSPVDGTDMYGDGSDGVDVSANPEGNGLLIDLPQEDDSWAELARFSPEHQVRQSVVQISNWQVSLVTEGTYGKVQSTRVDGGYIVTAELLRDNDPNFDSSGSFGGINLEEEGGQAEIFVSDEEVGGENVDDGNNPGSEDNSGETSGDNNNPDDVAQTGCQVISASPGAVTLFVPLAFVLGRRRQSRKRVVRI